jgi:BlaR1 peptidase M56/Domain of unknown function (DUF3471)
VLAASLLMPLLVSWVTFDVAPHGLLIPDILGPDLAGLVVPPPLQVLAEAAPTAVAIDWLTVGSWLYLLVAAWFMLRLLVGCILMWRLCRSATPVPENWTGPLDVRTHPSVIVPSTFCSTILLPPSYPSWDAMQRRAVLAHEYSHVRRADFYVLALAAINRAVFWFNPLAWWLDRRVAELAEARSDAAAIQDIEDRARYAEILLDFASRAGRPGVSLAMARPKTVRGRIEHILRETIVPKKMDGITWAALVAGILPLTVVAAGAVVAQMPAPVQRALATLDDGQVQRPEWTRPQTAVYADPISLDNYVGYYQWDSLTVLTVRRLGDHLYVQWPGQQFEPAYPEGPSNFFVKRKFANAQISFITDAQGWATGLVTHRRGTKRFAKRIEEANAKAMQEGFARRRREHTPTPGSEAALRRHIDTFQQRQPAFDQVTEESAADQRSQLGTLQRNFALLGPLQSVAFRGVSASGRDVYLATFDNGMAIFGIKMADGGKIAGFSMWIPP